MSALRPLPRRPLVWAAPAAALVAALGLAYGLPGSSASADERPDLPARTAGQLLASLQGVSVDGLSGTVVQTSRLGLPELPGGSGDASLSPQSLASGSRTLRVWAAGEDRSRVALLGRLSESDVVRNGPDVWTYTSSTAEVTHLTLPAGSPGDADESPTTAPVTPQDAADRALAAIDPSTAVTVDSTARVAGRPAYQLVLTPRDGRTLVGRVQLALDSATSLPLRVQVYAAGGSTPAFEVGFTDLSLSPPDDSVFRFTPPQGSTVKEEQLPARQAPSPERSRPDTGLQVLGSGWTSVVVVPGAQLPAGGVLDSLTTRVAGGRLISSALVSVLVADDGTVYAGAVRGEDLQRVAATGAGLGPA